MKTKEQIDQAERDEALQKLRDSEACEAVMRQTITAFVEAVTDYEVFFALGGKATEKLAIAGGLAKQSLSTDAGKSLLAELEQLRSEKSTRLKPYPIQGGPSVPFEVMEPYENQCQRNHGQSIQRIAERGGFAPSEAYCVVTGMRWSQMVDTIGIEEAVKRWCLFAERINIHYHELEQCKAQLKNCSVECERLSNLTVSIQSQLIERDEVLKWANESNAEIYPCADGDWIVGHTIGRTLYDALRQSFLTKGNNEIK